MCTPMMGNRLPADRVWAADTGCFTQPAKYDEEQYLRWLDARNPETCLFATAPDVVGDAEATVERSLPVLPKIRDVGYEAALVGQDGMTKDMVPWNDIDAFFVGGSTEWKLGPDAAALVAEAKSRGKRTHMGRVNSLRRLRYADSIGCQSADGTFIAFAPTINIKRVRRWLTAMNETEE